jgi:signal transduction histidine kinase
MRERLQRFGGTMSIESSSTGTRILATIPVPKEDELNRAESLHAAIA